MVPFILGPREHHGVTSAEDYLAKHAAEFARRRRLGMRFQVHDSPDPLAAYVSGNQWVVDCECGAGNAVDPEWGVACCFACGAIHRQIVVPAAWRAIEQELLTRRPAERHWRPGETPGEPTPGHEA